MKFVIPVKLLGIVVLAVAGLIAVFFFRSKASALTKTAEADLKLSFQNETVPFKDLKTEVIQNDGSIAQVRATFTARTDCDYLMDGISINIRNGYPSESKKISDEQKNKGYVALTQSDLDALFEMGIFTFDESGWSDTYQMKEDAWKRCYLIKEYRNVGNQWTATQEERLEFDPFLLPPEEQEKADYKLTPEMEIRVKDKSKKYALDAFYHLTRGYNMYNSRFPWNVNLNGASVASSEITSALEIFNSYFKNSTSEDDINYKFLKQTDSQILDSIFISSKSESNGTSISLSTCFLAEGSMRSEERSLFDKNGEPRDVCFDNKTGNECYWCRRCRGDECKAYIAGSTESPLPIKGSAQIKTDTSQGSEIAVKQTSQDYSLTLTDSPEVVSAGKAATFTWRIDGPNEIVNHSDIHFGTSTDPGDFGTDKKPDNTKYTESIKDFTDINVDIPKQFIGNWKPEKAGTFYFRIHALIGDKNYWSEQYTKEVKP